MSLYPKHNQYHPNLWCLNADISHKSVITRFHLSVEISTVPQMLVWADDGRHHAPENWTKCVYIRGAERITNAGWWRDTNHNTDENQTYERVFCIHTRAVQIHRAICVVSKDQLKPVIKRNIGSLWFISCRLDYF